MLEIIPVLICMYLYEPYKNNFNFVDPHAIIMQPQLYVLECYNQLVIYPKQPYNFVCCFADFYCPPGYKADEKTFRCYLLVTVPMTNSIAAARCNSLNKFGSGSLVNLATKAAQDRLSRLFKGVTFVLTSFFINS